MLRRKDKVSLTKSKNLLDIQKDIKDAVYKDLLLEADPSDARVRELILWHINAWDDESSLSIHAIELLEANIFNQLRRLGVLQPLMDDDAVTEIMVNGTDKIFYEKAGILYKSNLNFETKEDLNNMLLAFYSKHNVNLSISQPMASLKLEDGSRAHAVLDNIAPHGPIFTIRKFTGIKPQIADLISSDFISAEHASYLESAILDKRGIIIGGGTGTGKTTLLNALSAYIPSAERIVSIEDSPELQLQNKENWVSLISKEDINNPDNNVDMKLLIKNALRMRPDRIIIGEVRGDEAYDMLQSTQTGHPGTLCTIHANDSEGMIYRLADLCLDASKLSYELILRHIINSFNVLMHIKRAADGTRYINEIVEVEQSDSAPFKFNYIYRSSYGQK